MIDSVVVIGARGRVGSALERTARRARRRVCASATPSSCCSASPTGRSPTSRQELAPGPWVAHVSGATPLAALEPHRRGSGSTRCRRSRTAAAPSSSTAPGQPSPPRPTRRRPSASSSPTTLGLRPFELDDERRAPTTRAQRSRRTTSSRSGGLRAACSTRPACPQEALDPLMRRMIENDFELTGPIERGDWETVERHLAAIARRAPELLERVPRARRADGAADRRGAGVSVCRTIADVRAALAAGATAASGSCRPWARSTPGHLRAAPRRARGVRHGRHEPLRQPDPVRRRGRPQRLPARRAARPRGRRRAGVDLVFAPTVDEMYPPGFQTWVEVTELGAILEGEHRPGHFRGVATVCLKLFTIVRPDVAFFGRKDAQQVEVLRRLVADLALELEFGVAADRARRRRARALLAERTPHRRRARARARAPPRARDPRPSRRARAMLEAPASTSTTSRSPRSTRPSSPPRSASARPA